MFGVLAVKNDSIIKNKFEYFNIMNDEKHSFSRSKYEGEEACNRMSYSKYKAENEKYILFFEGKIINQTEFVNVLNLDKNFPYYLLEAYVKSKNEFVKYLKGSFVIIIYDKKTCSIEAFRDPLGVMPLYYAIYENTFLFSTELRRLYAIKELNVIDWEYLKLELFSTWPKNYRNTWFSSIFRLPPHHILTIKKTKSVVKKYNKLKSYPIQKKLTKEEYIDLFSFKLEKAVRSQINDVTLISSHLSGGLDSTGITAIANEYALKNNIEINTYACGLDEKQLNNKYDVKDDRDLIFAVAESIGMSKPTIVSDNADISMEDLQHDVLLPRSNFTKNYLKEVCEQIQKRKGKILLSGFGGDECITYNQKPDSHIQSAFSNLKWNYLWEDRKAFGWKKIIYISLIQFSFFKRKNVKSKNKEYLLKERIDKNMDDSEVYSLSQSIISYLESPHVAYRIEREKEFASYYGIEMRYPYLDYNLISFFIELPSRYKLLNRQGRRMYREAIKRWVDYKPFIEQRKSRIPTVPIELLRQSKGIAKEKIKYDQIIDELPMQLKKIISIISYPIDSNDRRSQRNFRLYILLAEISFFVKRTMKNDRFS